jgi:ABC-type antimicrobial peptide transport system permease subunit
MLEQLQDRRRLLAVLAAFGVRRSTMSWSVLWQNTIPVLLGLVVALPAGVGLGMLLLAMVNEPLALDWPAMGFAVAVSLATTLLITALSMPSLWRMMRPTGLRTE